MKTSLLAGLLAILLGAAGLIRGAVPLAVPTGGGGTSSSPPIVVSDAWIAAPVPPTQAAAGYFTVYNTTAKPETLIAVTTGAGASNVLHTYVKGVMTVAPNGVTIPAHGKLALAVGQGHVMITQLFGTLKAGQTISMTLTFPDLPPVNVQAEVYAPGTHP